MKDFKLHFNVQNIGQKVILLISNEKGMRFVQLYEQINYNL